MRVRKITPVNNETPSVHNSTVKFKPTLCRLIRSRGLISIKRFDSQPCETESEQAPEQRQQKTFSQQLSDDSRTTSAECSTHRDLFSRDVASDSRRLATLAHAISSTKPTAPSINHNGRRTLPKNCSRKRQDFGAVVFVELRHFVRQARFDRAQLGGCLFRRHAMLSTSRQSRESDRVRSPLLPLSSAVRSKLPRAGRCRIVV